MRAWNWNRGMATTGILSLALVMGCSSMEDRIENVIQHELEQCKLSSETFYEASVAGGGDNEILAELCHLEPSEVEMDTDWRGRIRTGPAVWTAEENQDTATVQLTRVAWDRLDRAMSRASSDDVERLEEAEEHFQQAQEQYGDSAFVRQQRLENLLNIRAEKMSHDDDESLVGEAAEAYLAEVVSWAEDRDDREAVAQARMAVVSHIRDYLRSQERAVDRMESTDRDDRLRAAAEAAEDDGDTEAAEEYMDELERREEERPERIEQLEARIERATREICEYTEILNVDGIDDDTLRSQVTSAMGDYDCDFSEEEEEENGDDEE